MKPLPRALADAAAVPGFYIGNQTEMAAAIELEPDGRFAYALDYGAVSETAEGRWRLEGEQILLTVEKSQGAATAPSLATTPLQVAGVILLVAMVAAIALTLRRRKDAKFQDVSQQVRVRVSDRLRMVRMPSVRQVPEIEPATATATATATTAAARPPAAAGPATTKPTAAGSPAGGGGGKP